MFEAELERFYLAARDARRIMITATEREDGDSIAAELCVRRILERAFPGSGKTIHVINMNPCPPRYLFLRGSEEILPFQSVQDRSYDLGIVVDCGIDRSGSVKEIFASCPFRVKIDHHTFGNQGEYDVAIATNQVASTTELLYRFIGDPLWKIPLDAELAELIYIGILCDTGSFRYDLTRPSSHLVAAELLKTGFDFPLVAERVHLGRTYEMKKLLALVLERMEHAPHKAYLWSSVTREMVAEAGAAEDDIGDIIDEICFVNGVDVTILFVEQAPGVIRISFRSKGGVNVGDFARRIVPTGGGHPRASGCTIRGTLEQVTAQVLREMEAEVRRLGLTSL